MRLVISAFVLLIVLAALILTLTSHHQKKMTAERTIPSASATIASDKTVIAVVEGATHAERMVDRFNRAYLVSLALTALFGALGFVATAGINNYSKIVNQEQSTKIQELRSHIQSANVQIATLENETATANLKTEQLRNSLRWRDLSLEQRHQLSIALPKSNSRKLHLVFFLGDPEVIYFSNELVSVFQNAGWVVTAQGLQIGGSITFGMSVPPEATSDELAQILDGSGLPVARRATPPAVISSGANPKPGEAVLFVGLRANVIPPDLQVPSAFQH